MTEERIRVAFVDDEANILSSMRRSMLPMIDSWEMGFFNGGASLLEAMAMSPYAVVVSDMRMPGMDGASLLELISTQYPETVRVILSGFADIESVYRTVGPAHIYLAKPCDPGVLRQAIKSRLTLRNLLSGQEMRRLLGGLSSLPSVPPSFRRVIAELVSPGASVTSVAEIVGSDVAMTADLLKLTNSSYFSINAKVATPLQAVRILGMDTVQTLVLQHDIFRLYEGNAALIAQIGAINDYSVVLAKLAEQVAIAANMPEEIGETAGCAALLSAVGSLILLSEKGEAYGAALKDAGPDRSLHEVETETFGADHALIGAYLLSLWGFTDAIVDAVNFAATPSQSGHHDNQILTALHVARSLGPSFPLLPDIKTAAVPFDLEYLSAAGHAVHIARWQELAVIAGGRRANG